MYRQLKTFQRLALSSGVIIMLTGFGAPSAKPLDEDNMPLSVNEFGSFMRELNSANAAKSSIAETKHSDGDNCEQSAVNYRTLLANMTSQVKGLQKRAEDQSALSYAQILKLEKQQIAIQMEYSLRQDELTKAGINEFRLEMALRLKEIQKAKHNITIPEINLTLMEAEHAIAAAMQSLEPVEKE